MSLGKAFQVSIAHGKKRILKVAFGLIRPNVFIVTGSDEVTVRCLHVVLFVYVYVVMIEHKNKLHCGHNTPTHKGRQCCFISKCTYALVSRVLRLYKS